jgi:uncharacterized membrane protein YgaE (UPF0421/DUF939 family)
MMTHGLGAITIAHVLIALIGLVNTCGLVLVAFAGKKMIVEIHTLVNSRLTEMLAMAAAIARAEGKEEQQRSEHAKDATLVSTKP